MGRFAVATASAICLGVSIFATSAIAEPDRVSILLGSKHIGQSGFEEVNPGIIVTWEDRAWGLDYSLGAYRNSFGKGSVVATAALPIKTWKDGQLSAFGGLALYPGNGDNFLVHAGDVVPIGGLQIRHKNVFGMLMPGDSKDLKAILAFGVTFKLKQTK